MRLAHDSEGRGKTVTEAANGELGCTSDKLEELAALLKVVAGHDLNEVLDRPAVGVVAVVGLDRLLKS